jgi:hypothetical protein
MSGGVHILKQSVIMNHLVSFLSVLDYINLRRALVHVSSSNISPADLVLRRFKNRLIHDFNASEEVVVTLVSLLTERSDVFLSGGILVSILRGDTIKREGQDVDLFFSDYLILKDTCFWINPHANVNFNPADDDADVNRVYDGMVEVIYVYTRGDIQFIEHKSDAAILDSISKFDIPICRNLYNKERGLRIQNMKALTRGHCVVDIPQWVGRVRDMHDRTSLTPCYERLLHRMKKYEERGFELEYRVGTQEEVQPFFKYPIEKVPPIIDRIDVYRLMGKHNPDSCIYTKDCKCKSAGDPAARWCTNFISTIHSCNCEHHQVFYKEMKSRYLEEHATRLWEEYERYWNPYKSKQPQQKYVDDSPELKKRKH